MSETRSELIRLIDEYRDRHGQPSEASIARAIGTRPQTVSSWRKRGLRQLPADALLRRLATLLGVPYEDYLLQVALYDVGRRDSLPQAREEDAG